MSIWKFPTHFFVALLFVLLSGSLYAQQHFSVQLEGVKMRAPLSLPKGNSTVQICGLEAGNSYKIVATPMRYGQPADFEIAPATAFSKGASNIPFLRAKKHSVSFSAPSACVEIQVKTGSLEQGAEVPMYLSILCESCPEANDWLKKITGQAEQAVLDVQGGLSAQALVEDVLVGGGCFQISNVTYAGQPGQIGTFSNGLSNIGFNTGVIMATGDISVATGPNDADGSSLGYGIDTPDSDLETLTNSDINDMANIEFDLCPRKLKLHSSLYLPPKSIANM
jgi:hypothetical protein